MSYASTPPPGAPAQGAGNAARLTASGISGGGPRRNGARIAVGAIIVAFAALASVLLYQNIGKRELVLQMNTNVQPGQKITASMLTETRVAADASVNLVPASSRDSIINSGYATTSIQSGALLTSSMISTSPLSGVPDGQVKVGLLLDAGRVPSGMAAGSAVEVVVFTPVTGQPQSLEATVVSVSAIAQSSSSSSTRTAAGPGQGAAVDLYVDADDATTVTEAASQGQIALVLLPTTAEG